MRSIVKSIKVCWNELQGSSHVDTPGAAACCLPPASVSRRAV